MEFVDKTHTETLSERHGEVRPVIISKKITLKDMQFALFRKLVNDFNLTKVKDFAAGHLTPKSVQLHFVLGDEVKRSKITFRFI